MNVRQSLLEFVRFSRPHTIIGTSLSVTVLFLIAVFTNGVSQPSYPLLLNSLIACLGANVYIVGINQITDVSIDKINKPYLPLASGAFSMRVGYALVSIGFLTSLIFAWFTGHYLFLTVIVSLMLGSAYSLRPFRLKRFHFWAAFCIIAIRGLIVNVFLYLHFQYEMTGVETLPYSIILLTVAMFGYSLVIAWFKDIPDVQGDATHHIKTMTIRIGPYKVLLIGNLLLSIILLGLAMIPLFVVLDLNPWIMMGVHFLMLAMLWYRNSKVDPKIHDDVRKYYLFIWTLFFLEYISFAIAAGYDL